MTTVRITKKIPPGFSLDVEFTLAPGITALLGPAGAGKTVILEALAGLVRPDSGRILLDDAILYDGGAAVDAPPRDRRCAYISHDDSLFPHMTVRQNLAFAAGGFPRLERHRRIAETLARWQLTELAAAAPRSLTGAQGLRTAIARDLIVEPKLLLMDERGLATGAGEALLAELRAATPAPILLVTADLDLCCAAANQLLLLEAGRIVQRGAPREVVEGPESVEAARLLGYENILEATIAALDPGRDASRLAFENFELAAPYIPGHFRGDRVSVAIRPTALRLHSGDAPPPLNSVKAELLRTHCRTQTARLEFSGGIVADVVLADYERLREARAWQVEFPAENLRIL